MAEYIDREALCVHCGAREINACSDECEVFNAPAADVVERKRGRWIWDERFHDYTCSECNNWDLKTPNYCSNCGADMREVDHAKT